MAKPTIALSQTLVQLSGAGHREATSDDVSDLRTENDQLKQLVAELSLDNRILKKSSSGLE